MKLEDIIQRVQSLYSKGVESDDSRLSRRHIYNKLLTTRSKLISQEAKKKQKISQWNYQTLYCVELIEVPKHECPCIPPIGCNLLRSKNPLPEPITGFSDDLIQSVSSIDREIKLDRITINAVKNLRGNKYTYNKPNYFIQSDYLYVTTYSLIKQLVVIGLFEDPIEAAKYESICDECTNCTDCSECPDCFDYLNFDFPIDNDMIDVLIELTSKELVVMFSQNIEDATNDTRDNIKDQSK